MISLKELIHRLLATAILGLEKHKPGPGTISDQPLDLRRTPLHYQSQFLIYKMKYEKSLHIAKYCHRGYAWMKLKILKINKYKLSFLIINTLKEWLNINRPFRKILSLSLPRNRQWILSYFLAIKCIFSMGKKDKTKWTMQFLGLAGVPFKTA